MKSIIRSICCAALFIGLVGCSSLKPDLAPVPVFYTLDLAPMPARASLPGLPEKLPTLLVSPSTAASGFDSQHIIYTRVPHQLEYFAQSEWIDTPARMLGPLLIDALTASGAFHAVVAGAGATAAELRLATQIVRLQHEFDTTPGQVHFTLRAYLIDNATRKVVAFREFDEIVVPASDAPHDGIVATNQAVQKGLQELSLFCASTAYDWQISQAKLSVGGK